MSSWWCARTIMHNALWQFYSLDPNGYRAQISWAVHVGSLGCLQFAEVVFEFRGFPRSMTSGSFVQACWQSRLHSPALSSCFPTLPALHFLQILMMLLGNVCYRCPPVIIPGMFPCWPVTRIFCCWKILSPQKPSPKAVNWVYGCSSQ